MGKIIIKADTTYKIDYKSPYYTLYKRIGKWYNRKWHKLYSTSNKVKFKNQIHRYFLSGE